MAKLVCVMVLVFSALVGVSVAASPDLSDLDFQTELAQREEFPASDFIFKFPTEDQSTKFGNLRNLFINNDPILATLPNGGVAQNLVTLEACAVNQPHSHPRGTEISFVTEGVLLFGFVEENGGRPFVGGNVTKGQTVIIPQGLIHFAQNLGCKEAQFIASFPNRDPGTQTTALNFFGLPLETIRGTTGLSDKEIKKIQASVKANKNPSLDSECAKRCGLKW